MVHQVDIDAIGLQALERAFNLSHDVPTRSIGIVNTLRHWARHLRGYNDIIAASSIPHHFAQDHLGCTRAPSVVAKPVDVGAVNQVQSAVKRGGDRLLGIRGIILPTESEPERHARHLDASASKVHIFTAHVGSPS